MLAPGLDDEALRAAAARMVDAIRHRGPDGRGVFADASKGCALAHARLSIIDLTEAAGQPMFGSDGQLVLAFNGEVYNFQALREELAVSRTFTTRSDTEVVLAAYERWGIDAFRRLNGMFAIALLDRQRGRLVLARDRLGIKPLYFAQQAGRLVFGSEIKALLASGLIDSGPDLAHLHEYLHFGSTLGEATLYAGVRRLMPGHWMEFDLRSGQAGPPTAYWSPVAAFQARTASGSLAAVVGRTRQLLEDGVRRQLVADVPVGVFLSGGVDSSAIVALASRHYGGRLRTYSVGFDYLGDRQELPKARGVAERFGTEHHELHVSAADITSTIERLAFAHDQPFADPANVPLYQLCQALGGETKVVLQGDGGDELFGGYRRYEYLSAAAFARPLAALADRVLKALDGHYGRRLFGAHRFFHGLARLDPAERMALLLTVEGPLNPPTRILNPALRAEIGAQDAFARYREVASSLPRTDDLQQMLLTDLQILLPDIFLEKVDRATMAAGIEVRVPFLDFELVDYVLGLPSHYKVAPGRRKRLLRQALDGIVPADVLHARKVGFGVPINGWLSGPLRRYAEDRILAHAGHDGWFDAQAVRALFDEHASGRRDHAQILWKALQCALWRERTQGAVTGNAGSGP